MGVLIKDKLMDKIMYKNRKDFKRKKTRKYYTKILKFEKKED